jgi:hypothetical protein
MMTADAADRATPRTPASLQVVPSDIARLAGRAAGGGGLDGRATPATLVEAGGAVPAERGDESGEHVDSEGPAA